MTPTKVSNQHSHLASYRFVGSCSLDIAVHRGYRAFLLVSWTPFGPRPIHTLTHTTCIMSPLYILHERQFMDCVEAGLGLSSSWFDAAYKPGLTN